MSHITNANAFKINIKWDPKISNNYIQQWNKQLINFIEKTNFEHFNIGRTYHF